MTNIKNQIHNIKACLYKRLEKFSFCHPVISFFGIFIGIPTVVFLVVSFCVAVILLIANLFV